VSNVKFLTLLVVVIDLEIRVKGIKMAYISLYKHAVGKVNFENQIIRSYSWSPFQQ